MVQLCIQTKTNLKQWCDYTYEVKQICGNDAIMHTN